MLNWLMSTSSVASLGDLITAITATFTALMAQIPNVAAAITGNAILLLGISIFFAGTVVAFFIRLLRST